MPSIPPNAAPRLSAFKRALEAALPGKVAAVILFGSRARGDAGLDSDYDLAVLLRDGTDKDWAAQEALSDTAYDHILEGFFLAPVGLPADYLAPVDGRFRTELARHVARDGVAVP